MESPATVINVKAECTQLRSHFCLDFPDHGRTTVCEPAVAFVQEEHNSYVVKIWKLYIEDCGSPLCHLDVPPHTQGSGIATASWLGHWLQPGNLGGSGGDEGR